MAQNAYIYVSANEIEIVADWTNFHVLGFLKALEMKHGFTARWNNQKNSYTVPLAHLAEVEHNLRSTHVAVLIVGASKVPAEPVTLRVEYIGACKHRPNARATATGRPRCPTCGGSGIVGQGFTPCSTCCGTGAPQQEPLSYATGWVNGGWNAQFPEKVLREYFPSTEAFDGDFYKALLRGSDINKEYKKLARVFHPDINKRRNAHSEFVKLRQAFDDLKDPVRRKRYAAGLKFQVVHQDTQVGFRIPKNCGDVVVEADVVNDGFRELIKVTKIISWNDVVDDQGRIMCSSFNPSWRPVKRGTATYMQEELPFTITWEYPGGFEIDI